MADRPVGGAVITNVETHRTLDMAIDDFLRAGQLTPDRLVDTLKLHGLGIGQLNEDGELAAKEQEYENLLRATVNEVVERLRSAEGVRMFIDIDTRNLVEAIEIEDAIDAAERAWEDGD